MVIELRHAALVYQSPEGEVEAVRDVSLEVEEGEFVSLVGPSGCGKSTLLHAIAGLEKLSGGQVWVCHRPVLGPGDAVGLMPQRDQLFEWENIRRNVTLGLRVRGKMTPEYLAHVESLLQRYELEEFADKRPGELSGGMRQRCALIRTLATKPEILLLDEPFSALDYQTRLAVSQDVWRIIRAEQKTALLVTHDISEAVSMSDKVVVLSRRPAEVREVLDMGQLKSLPPLQRRDTPEFAALFNEIWKGLEICE